MTSQKPEDKPGGLSFGIRHSPAKGEFSSGKAYSSEPRPRRTTYDYERGTRTQYFGTQQKPYYLVEQTVRS